MNYYVTEPGVFLVFLQNTSSYLLVSLAYYIDTKFICIAMDEMSVKILLFIHWLLYLE